MTRGGPYGAVVGAGVIGLTSAVRLLERGVDVTVVTRERPEARGDDPTALFHPFDAAPRERVDAWARASYAAFARLARDPDAGVAFTDVVEVHDAPGTLPSWHGIVPSYRAATRRELPHAYRHGFTLRVPVIDVSRFTAWLTARVIALGGRFETRDVRDVRDAAAGATFVVNATGAGARTVVGDADVHAARGHVLRVDAPPPERVLVHAPTGGAPGAFALPHADTVTVGRVAAQTRAPPSGAVEREGELMGTARALAPELEGGPVVRVEREHPERFAVRVETEERDGVRVIHNYGHGRAGVTLSWGCAEEVVERARAVAISRSLRPRLQH